MAPAVCTSGDCWRRVVYQPTTTFELAMICATHFPFQQSAQAFAGQSDAAALPKNVSSHQVALEAGTCRTQFQLIAVKAYAANLLASNPVGARRMRDAMYHFVSPVLIGPGIGNVRFYSRCIFFWRAAKRVVDCIRRSIGRHEMDEDEAVTGITNIARSVVAEGVRLRSVIGSVAPVDQPPRADQWIDIRLLSSAAWHPCAPRC